MKELNTMRLLAGIPIDGSIEVTEAQINEAVENTAALNDFWCVSRADKPDLDVGDILHRTNTKGLVHKICSAADKDKEFENDFLLFDGSAKREAMKEAKKRIREANKAAVEAEEEMFFKKAEQEYEEEMEYEEATKLADQDYDGDGQIETQAAEHAGAKDRAIKKVLGKSEEECEMEEEMEELEQEMDSFEPATNICPDCVGSTGDAPADPDCKRCGGAGEVFEAKKAKPDFLDADKDGDKKESMKKAQKDKKKDLKENKYEVKCTKSGTITKFTTDRDLDVGDVVKKGGGTHKVVKVLSEGAPSGVANIGDQAFKD